MDFIDVLRQFSLRADKLRQQVQTEEATKTSLVMPFFQQVFGYDVFNPDEFIPEFTADVGIKKGEKVDYAICLNGEPTILIEVKWCGTSLEKHDSQLFRYFGTTKAKFAILTNGLIYKFYTDLDEQNKMDLKPFLELNVLDIKEVLIPELKRFCKSTFNSEEVFSRASELKYSGEIRNYFTEQLNEPSDDFVRFILSNIYDGAKKQTVVEKFKPIVKTTLNNLINEMMNDKITAALKAEKVTPDTAQPAEVETIEDKVLTTEEELEAFGIIKGLLAGVIEPAMLSYRDTESYFSVLYNGKVTKWICRLYLDGKKKVVSIHPSTLPPYDKDAKYQISTIDELYAYRENLIAAAKRYIEE